MPQDDKAKAVYLRLNFDNEGKGVVERPIDPNGRVVWQGRPRVDGLEFFGKVQGNEAKLLLLYPNDAEPAKKGDEEKLSAVAKLLRQQGAWGEATITLDFSKAKKVDVPASAFKRAKAVTANHLDCHAPRAAHTGDARFEMRSMI